MDLLHGNKLFGFFGPSPKTLDLLLRRPRLMRSWGFTTLSDEPPSENRPTEYVRGTARITDGDSINIIGADQEPGRSLRLHLKAFESWDAAKAEWSAHNEGYGHPLKEMEESAQTDDEKRLLQYLRNVYRKFEQIPPTAWVGFMEASEEIGNTDTWWIDGKLPQTTFDALAVDLRTGNCHSLRLCIELVPSLVDSEYAPPNVPVTFGIFRLGTFGTPMAHGWVRTITWRENRDEDREVSVKPLENADELSESEPAPEATVPSIQIEESFTTLSSQISALAQSTRRGFLFVFVILVIVVLLRIV